MTAPGKLIAVEGIDGSGKRTQVERLTLGLQARGYSIESTGFPQYESWFGKIVGQFLNGDLGSLENVDPHFTTLLYAGDRFEAKPKLEAALNNGQIVLVDRYVGSNLAHQTARVPSEKRAVFLEWIEHLEYGIYGLPKEDLVLYLRVPAMEAQKLVALKSARSYTSAQKDLLEASLRHLEDAAQMYDSRSNVRAGRELRTRHRRLLRRVPHVPSHLLARQSPNVGRARTRRARRERRSSHCRACTPNFADAPRRLGARPRSRPAEESCRATYVACGPVACRSARRLLSTDGPPPCFHPGRRRDDALGCSQCFPENSRGASRLGHPHAHRALAICSSADDRLALPAISFRAASATRCGENPERKNQP